MADIPEGWNVVDWSAGGGPHAAELGMPWVKVSHDGNWPGYTFTVRLDNQLALTGFDVDRTSGEPLTAARLRKVPLGEIAALARARIVGFWIEFDRGRSASSKSVDPTPEALLQGFNMKRRGRKGRPERELAIAAAAYVRCCTDDRYRKTPMTALAEQTGFTVGQLRGLLGQARQRGLLTDPPGEGVPGGILTDRAWALLPTAWERSTPDKRDAAAERDKRLAPIDDALLEGRMTHDDWWEVTRKEYGW